MHSSCKRHFCLYHGMAPGSLTCLGDLPPSLVEQITALARGRILPGTNRYAQVCRQWQEAGDSSDEAQPLLQLYSDQRWIDGAGVARLSHWMAMHGHHVGAVVYEATPNQHQSLDWFLSSAAALCNLTRLEVTQRDSLFLLAPVLGQLPQLQHLAVEIGLKEEPVRYMGLIVAHKSPLPPPGGMDAMFFKHTDQQHGLELPSMQQLCPQLIHLQLTIEPCFHNVMFDLRVDERLAQMLPCGLQQLTLVHKQPVDVGDEDVLQADSVWLHPSSVQGLTALQTLALYDVRVLDSSVGCLLQNLEALQQLRVCTTHTAQDKQGDEGTLLQLAPLLTDLQVHNMADVLPVNHAPLTRLVWSKELLSAEAPALGSLTGLRELDLGDWDGDFPHVAAVVEQAAGMPALHSLCVRGFTGEPAAVSSSLDMCTQLTSLALLMEFCIKDSDESESADESQESHESEVLQQVNMGPLAFMLQQLTGLRCLTVYSQLQEWEGAAWLAPLSALTCLCVQLPDFSPEQPGNGQGVDFQVVRPDGEWLGQRNQAEAKGLLGQVRKWPSSLQCVVFCIAALPPTWGDVMLPPRCWEHPTAGHGSRQLKVWLELPSGAAQGWPRPFWPCPHLQGVCELQGPGLGS